MARNAELVRQWEILRAIDGARHGIPVAKLAAERGVHQRTIRRDMDALCRAGFPLYDEKVNGTSLWKLRARPFGRLEETGLGLMELCALYFSRAMLVTLAGTPLLDEAERAFAKIERALPLASRRFLDRLPRVLTAKADGRKRHDERRLREILARVLDATLLHRRAAMQYVKGPYIVEPQRIVYAHGGIYVIAFVPAYGEMRTFAAERIRTFALLDELFEPRPLPAEPFADSLGVFTGTPADVTIDFDARAATFIREREWHRSQRLEEIDGGGVRLTLTVCHDQPLRSWILGFGAAARVVSPQSLAEEMLATLEEARLGYRQALGAAEGRRPEMLRMSLRANARPA